MALLWHRTVNGKRYEVRTAGKSRRLYTDGVFHSQIHSQRYLTNNVWDVLSLPSLFLPAEKLRRVLVLGVGGGAVIRQISQLFPHVHFTAVELDATHLYVARNLFGLKKSRVHWVHGDAIEWLRQYRGARFDLIIEDLFTEKAGQPVRVVQADLDWFKQLTNRLSAHGMLVLNFISTRELRRCSYFHDATTRRKFASVFGFATPVYANEIGVFLQKPRQLEDWYGALARHSPVWDEFRQQKARYRFRELTRR